MSAANVRSIRATVLAALAVCIVPAGTAHARLLFWPHPESRHGLPCGSGSSEVAPHGRLAALRPRGEVRPTDGSPTLPSGPELRLAPLMASATARKYCGRVAVEAPLAVGLGGASRLVRCDAFNFSLCGHRLPQGCQ